MSLVFDHESTELLPICHVEDNFFYSLFIHFFNHVDIRFSLITALIIQ